MLERAQKSNVFYLIDINCLLAEKSFVVLNLKSRDATHISLMADTNDSDLIIPIIKVAHFLKSKGITIDNVLTLSDLYYRDMFDNSDFSPGGTYQEFTSTLELHQLALEGVELKTLESYVVFYLNKALLQAIRFLQEEFLNWGTKLSSILSPEGKMYLLPRIESYILKHYAKGQGDKPEDIHFEMTTKKFFEACSELLTIVPHRDCTLNALLHKHEMYDEELENSLPELSNQSQGKIKDYVADLKRYSNRLHYAYFTFHAYQQKGAYSRKQENGFSSQLGSYNKGDIYAWFVANNMLNQNDLVIYISDSQQNSRLLAKTHKKFGFKNLFEIACPRASAEDFKICLNSILRFHMKKCLENHASDKGDGSGKLNSEILQKYITYLFEEGQEALKNKAYLDASESFMMAYLLCDHQTEKLKGEVNKALIIKSITHLQKKLHENIYFGHKVTNFQDIIAAGGLALQMKIIHLNIALHKEYYPYCYRHYFSLWMPFGSSLFTTQQEQEKVNLEFMDKVVIRIINVAKKFKDEFKPRVVLNRIASEEMPLPNQLDVNPEDNDIPFSYQLCIEILNTLSTEMLPHYGNYLKEKIAMLKSNVEGNQPMLQTTMKLRKKLSF
jgi:hypothetical protein